RLGERASDRAPRIARPPREHLDARRALDRVELEARAEIECGWALELDRPQRGGGSALAGHRGHGSKQGEARQRGRTADVGVRPPGRELGLQVGVEPALVEVGQVREHPRAAEQRPARGPGCAPGYSALVEPVVAAIERLRREIDDATVAAE